MRRSWQGMVGALVLTVSLALTGCSGASTGTEDQSTAPSVTEMLDDAQSTQTWDPKTGELKITIKTGASTRAGWCWAAIFDWMIDRSGNNQHHDPRLFMVCQPGVEKEYTFKDSPDDGLVDMQKAGLCYGPRETVNKPPTGAKCMPADPAFSVTGVNTQLPKPGTVTTVEANPCLGLFVLEEGNKATTGTGGDPRACRK